MGQFFDTPANSVYRGDAGDDFFVFGSGGGGSDTITGNGGNDTFAVIIKSDTFLTDQIITDFSINDTIRIATTQFITAKVNGTGASIQPYTMQVNSIGGITYLFVEGNGDSLADVKMRFPGIYKAEDFTFTQTTTTSFLTDIRLNGSAAVDTLSGSNSITGTSGADTLFGGGGADTLDGSLGNDVLYGGYGVVDTNDGNDWIYGGTGSDTIYGNAGNDIIYGGANQNTVSGDLGDLIYAGYGADFILAGDGNDSLYGGGGTADPADLNDQILGEAGNDYILSNGGNDILNGGTGNDTMHGGLGDDTYIFRAGDGVDTILHFTGAGQSGGDVLEFVRSGSINSASDLLGRMTFANNTATFALDGGDSITIVNLTAALTAGDISII